MARITKDRLRRWAAKDPNRYALHRSIRVAVVMPLNFAIASEIIGNAQVATLAAFGSFALLLFVDFPGSRSMRAFSYTLLAVAGAALISLGTLLSRPAYVAVISMAIVGFGVLFAGVVSSTIAAAGRATLLAFILPVMIPATPAQIPARLLGWGIACAVAIPAALFIWPPRDRNQLAVRAGHACHALGHALELEPSPTERTGEGDAGPDQDDPTEALRTSVADLRAAFRATAVRPVALSTGSRLLMGLVDEIEWLSTMVAAIATQAPTTWSTEAQRMRRAASAALHACASVLGGGDERDEEGEAARGTLEDRVVELASARQAVARRTLVELQVAAALPVKNGQAVQTVDDLGADDGDPDDPTRTGDFDRPLYAAHELGYVVGRVCATVRLIATANARSWLDRLLGRPPRAANVESSAGVRPDSPMALGEVAAAELIARSHLDRHSVAWQNAVRGASGLALAVLIARVSGVQEGFWVVLGALSVLRSNAVSTGSTAARAVAGTVIGFGIGALLVAAIGTQTAVLWSLLPVAVFVAAYTPDLISFAAGQAAFSVTIIILFNIIVPTGWSIGVLRVTDVALGAAASAAAGLLFWPRGAGPALGRALADAYRLGADQVVESVAYATDRRADAPARHGPAQGAAQRLDAAFRQYLAERGAKNLPLSSVTMLANGASRLRLAGEAIARLRQGSGDEYSSALRPTVDVLLDETDRVATWYRTLGDTLGGAAISHTGTAGDGYAVDGDVGAVERASVSFLDVVLPAIDRCGEPDRAGMAERLLWSGQYVGDVNRMRADLVQPAAQVRLRWRATNRRDLLRRLPHPQRAARV